LEYNIKREVTLRKNGRKICGGKEEGEIFLLEEQLS